MSEAQNRVRCVLGAAAIFLLWGASSLAQQKVLKKEPISETVASDGFEMYHTYCGSCHGADGRGHGPAAAASKVPPTDLTGLARNNGGRYPALAVISLLSKPRGSHGGSGMPVWGSVFRDSGEGETMVRLRIYNLNRYLESMQEGMDKRGKHEKPARKP